MPWSPDEAVNRTARRRNRPLVFAASLVATAAISAGAAVAITLAVTNRPSSSAATGFGRSATSPTQPATGSPGGTDGLNVASIAARVDPATVDITASGPNGQDEGTGIILTSTGTVLTNNHVIDGSTKISAQIDGAGRSYPATVLGTDAIKDVALLRLDGGSKFKTATLGDSSAITLGEPVVAIGNALALPGPETVTNGIISATKRSISVGDPTANLNENLKGMIQTSAPINPGNSGGPLVDAAGKVVGMNTAAASSTSSGETASNVGFAIPINSAIAIARQIEAGKHSATVLIGAHAIMGVEVTSVPCSEGRDGCTNLGLSAVRGLPIGSYTPYTAPVSKGAVVAEVVDGSPAAGAGLAPGDVITSVDGGAVTSPDQLSTRLRGRKVGAKIAVAWAGPGGGRHSATLHLMAAPAA